MALASDLISVFGNIENILKSNPSQRATTSSLSIPVKEYTILFTARSGSTYLTDLLESAGLGVPREWLNPGFVKGQAEHFGAGNFDDYFHRMRSEFSPGGIFGHEMTLWFYQYFSKEVRLEDYFDFLAPSVLLFRQNVIDQAVSLYLAASRGVFHKTREEDDVNLEFVPYDANEIKRYISMFTSEENGLRHLCSSNGWSPYYLSYERLMSSSPAAVAGAFGRLLDAPVDFANILTKTQKLGNAVNVEYAERFSAENSDFCEMIASERAWLSTMLDSRALLADV